MTVSFCFICAVAVLSKASMQARVEGVTGGFVILPCPTNSTDELKTEDIIVHWRQNDVKIVYDIINGTYSSSGQDPEYKSRAETFPDEYKEGNFSLKLKNLTHTDAGEYQCFISHLSDPVTLTIQLIVNESTSHNEKQSAPHTEKPPTAGNGTKVGETRTNWILTVVLCAFLLCVSICVALILRKRCAKTSGSGISVPGGLSCRDSKSVPANIDHQDYSVLQTNT